MDLYGVLAARAEENRHIIRLVDDLEIPHGTAEFRDAQKEQKEILSLLNQNVGEAQGFIFTPSDDGEIGRLHFLAQLVLLLLQNPAHKKHSLVLLKGGL